MVYIILYCYKHKVSQNYSFGLTYIHHKDGQWSSTGSLLGIVTTWERWQNNENRQTFFFGLSRDETAQRSLASLWEKAISA